MSSNPDPLTQLIRTGRAATYTLIALLGLCYVLAWVTKSDVFVHGLWFAGDWTKPWSLLTYPFASAGVGGNLIWELLLLFWLYWIGGDLEREMGTARVFAVFLVASALGAVSVYVAWMLARGAGAPLYGSLIPIGALTVAWGTRNQTACVRLWMVIPITGKWIAIIEAGLVLFVMGEASPIVGIFALAPLGVAWAYAANRLPGFPFGRSSSRPSKAAKATERREKSYYDDVFRRAKEREERERLRKLFESSLDDDK
ncbi:MAG: hypothetical protein ACYC96_12930 [Fimbriimonadaceae bacterium]